MMKMLTTIGAIFCVMHSPPLLADLWRETATGSLIPETNAAAMHTCDSSPANSYHSVLLPGHPHYQRIHRTPAGFRFSGDSVPEQQIMPFAQHAAAGTTDFPAHWGIQWLNARQPQSAYRLVWHEPDGQWLRAARVTLTPLQWEPEWTASYSASALSWLSGQVTALKLADDPAQQWIVLPGDAQVPIRLFHSKSGVPRQLSIAPSQGSFALLPLADDRDKDGLVERLYLLSEQGLLWQYDWRAGTGWQSRVLADLRAAGWQFNGSLQRFDARWRHSSGWQQGDVFVMQARSAQDYHLLVLRRSEPSQTFTYADIGKAPNLSQPGWQTEIPARPVTKVKVLAGVLYLPLKAATGCDQDAAYDQLLALQLYSGGPVYDSPVLTLTQPVRQPLQLRQIQQQFQIWSGQTQVVPQLRTLDPGCLMCTEVLTEQHLQGESPLAVFRHEQVY